MIAIHQCNPRIWVYTPLGEGHCIFIIDYGESVNTVWVVHLFNTGEVKHFDSNDIKIAGNGMYGIKEPV